LLVRVEAGEARVPELALLEAASELGLQPVRRQYLGLLGRRQVVAAELGGDARPPDGMVFENLRSVFSLLPEDHLWLANRAIQIVEWDRDHQFCGRCRTPTENQDGERAKRCPSCGLAAFPRLSPAVIVLVERGDEILLARSPHFLPGVYSTLAGFVEPGETLEQTVAREIEEEVGVQVRDVRYFGSQPWPFPNSLMIGFRARWAGGELTPDPAEIEDAGWFRADALPRLPSRISIARALIEAFLAERS
jgi:NAD+ diphosphatase